MVARVAEQTGTETAAPVGAGARRALLVAAAVTLALYALPGGDILARPLVWVSTLFHEYGHAAATTAAGGDVVAVRVFADGSGVTEGRRPAGRVRTAFVAAGGLVGPAAVAGLLFAGSRRRNFGRVGGAAAGAVLLLTIPFAARGALAIAVALVLGAGALGLALRAPPRWTQIALLFLAIQLALSVFSRGDYLFTATAQTGIGAVPSDSAQIATALAGPYWFWGAVCGLVSVAILVGGLAAALRRREVT